MIRYRPFVQRVGERAEPLAIPDKIGDHPFVSAFDITNDGFILGNYGETNGPGFYIRSRTFLLGPSKDSVGFAGAEEPSLVADYDVGFSATNSALGINDEFEMVGMSGEVEGECADNISFYQSVNNSTVMLAGGSAELSQTRILMRVANRVSTALAKINREGVFVGTTDTPEGALIGLVGSMR